MNYINTIIFVLILFTFVLNGRQNRRALKHIGQKLGKIMSEVDELNAAVTRLEGVVSATGAELKKLAAEVAAIPVPPSGVPGLADLTSRINALADTLTQDNVEAETTANSTSAP